MESGGGPGGAFPSTSSWSAHSREVLPIGSRGRWATSSWATGRGARGHGASAAIRDTHGRTPLDQARGSISDEELLAGLSNVVEPNGLRRTSSTPTFRAV
eukprot:523771-Prorocentrum_minimum.AAC.2